MTNQASNNAPNARAGLVLIVDDDIGARQLLQSIMSKEYEVEVAESGSDALQMLLELTPDLIVLDIEMPGLNGYETCRRIRETSTAPVIFVTAHTSLESQLEAFEAGANDIVPKPVPQDLFLRKAALAINTHLSAQRLQLEKKSFESMATNLLSFVGESGILFQFLRNSIQCRTYYELSMRLVETAHALGIQCFGVIRSGSDTHYFRSEGEPTALEKEVLAKVATMGERFQFKRQLVVNCDHVSIISTNVPLDSQEKTSTFSENLRMLADAAEQLAENVEMRQESMARAEQLQVALMGASGAVQTLQQQYRQMMADTRMLLQELVENIENSFSWLGATTDQEMAINNTMNQSVEQILELLATRGQFEAEFAALLAALRGPESEGDIDLF
jgi:CheY-like chemotaxis protein